MKILIIGERYSENLGDAVICETVYNIIKKEYKDSKIDFFDLSGKIDYNKYYSYKRSFIKKIKWYILEKIIKLTLKPFYELYIQDRERHRMMIELYTSNYKKKNYDIAIFAGGALFMDYFSCLLFYLVKQLSKRKCKIIFHSCGMGILSSNSISLLRQMFKNPLIKCVSLRDSFARFNDLFDIDCYFKETSDTALNCAILYNSSNIKEADFGIGLISIPKYYSFQLNLVKKFYNSQYSWKLFTNGSPWDQKVAYSILKDIGIEENEMNNYVMKRPQNPQELINTITSFNTIVSYRMHSQIIASSFLIPSYGFIWNDKVKEFYSKLGFSSFSFKPQEIEQCWNMISTKKMNYEILKQSVFENAEKSKKCLLEEISIVKGSEI